MELETLVVDFADAIRQVDASAPQAESARSKRKYQPGIGPHTEAQTVELVANSLIATHPDRYAGFLETGVPYLDSPRQKCDLCWGEDGRYAWAIEVKMLRILGDNGKPNDNMLMHILSPYPNHRSALTDCDKLAQSRLGSRNSIIVYAYEAEYYPISITIEAFELLAGNRVNLGPRIAAPFVGLIHPVHASGAVFGWEIL